MSSTSTILIEKLVQTCLYHMSIQCYKYVESTSHSSYRAFWSCLEKTIEHVLPSQNHRNNKEIDTPLKKKKQQNPTPPRKTVESSNKTANKTPPSVPTPESSSKINLSSTLVVFFSQKSSDVRHPILPFPHFHTAPRSRFWSLQRRETHEVFVPTTWGCGETKHSSSCCNGETCGFL